MSVNADLQGAQYSLETPFDVGREAITEFARSVGATHPAHFDTAAAQELGYADVIAPATFAVVPSQRCEALYISNPDAGIDYSRVVHGQEQFTYTRPIVAGDRLAATTHVDGLREAGGNAMITTRTELTDAATGDAVVTVTSTIVVRGEK